MGKEDEVIRSLSDMYNKMVWLNRTEMEPRLRGYTASEVHCIEYVGSHTDANVTQIAAAFYMTRSAASKITKKLLDKGVLDRYQKPENRKEIYFRLTDRGMAVYKVHQEIHEGFRARDRAVFEQLTDEQLDCMLRFSQRYRAHLDAEIQKLDVELPPQAT